MSHVYLIHLPEHTDIKTQGYVGIGQAPYSKSTADMDV